MIIKLDSELKTLEGKTIPRAIDEKGNMTVKSSCMNALLAFTPQDKSTGEEKFKRYELAMTIKAAKKEVELSVEDVALLKKLVGQIYPPLIMGQVWVILEDNKKEDA